jgi:predicted nucleic acid-binding protein
MAAVTSVTRSVVPIILDASVALKLVTNEPGTVEAQALLRRDEERVAPDWMMTEVASGLVEKIRRNEIDGAGAQTAFAALPSFIDRFVATRPMLPRAMVLAAELDHALYDCVYLQAAIEEDCVVVTADDGMVAAAKRGGFAERTERLQWTK